MLEGNGSKGIEREGIYRRVRQYGREGKWRLSLKRGAVVQRMSRERGRGV